MSGEQPAPGSRLAESDSEHPAVVVVGVDARANVIPMAASFAKMLNARLEAVHVETPDNDGLSDAVAEGLAAAQARGAQVSNVPAPTVCDGLIQHVQSVRATHIVLGHRALARRRWSCRRSLAERLLERGSEVPILLVPCEGSGPREARRADWIGSRGEYLSALLAVGLTTALAALLRETTNVISTSILFLFPVIAIAARGTLGATLLTVASSVLAHNFIFLGPTFGLDPTAVQSWVMAAVLLVVGAYTNVLTGSLRGRVQLSDRSARESARLASFVQRLTQSTDWNSTASAVCEEIGTLFDVETVLIREIEGTFAKVADYPHDAVLEPVDEVALQWAWEQGEAKGPEAYQPGKWQFHPLSTSLGVLAVLGLARSDGKTPIGPEQGLLFSTLLAQASLAHERLRLEDMMRAGRPVGSAPGDKGTSRQ